MRRATWLTEAPGAKASATIDCFCSVLHRRRRSGPDNTSTRLIPPSLAPVQITVLAPPLTKTDHPSARKAVANGRLRSLRHDPVFKMAVGRLPESGDALCSQPTMSRLENAPSKLE